MKVYKHTMSRHNYFSIALYALWFLICSFPISIKASVLQESVVGQVIDSETNQPISGVSVQVKGARLMAVTDREGNFRLPVSRLSGTVLVFSHLGYDLQEASATSEAMKIRLKPSSSALQEVTVGVSRRVNTEIALLDERRRAGVVQDGISAELMTRTASITASQALQRVVGVTVTDDKYVAVRGMGERSVIGQLNGSRLASANPDQSSIPFDMIPASLLDNITVYKSYTPDKPADAASGIVNLKTKSVPDSLIFEVIIQTGINSNIGLGGKYNSFWNSDMGAFGTKINHKNLRADFLKLATEYPNGLGSMQSLIGNVNFDPNKWEEAKRINGIMQSFDPILTTEYKTASPNQLYAVNFGNQYPLFKGKHTLGVILGGNYYRRKTDIYRGELTQWSIYQGVVTGGPIYSWRNIPNYITPNNLNMGKYQSYRENTGSDMLNYGALGGVAYRFSPRHEISAQFLGSWGGENNATNMDGAYEYTGLPGNVYSRINSLKQTFRSLYTYNLQGEHQFGERENAIQLSYSGSHSIASHNDPDYRFTSLAEFVPGDPDWSWYGFGRYTNEYDPDARAKFESRYAERMYALTSGFVNGYGPFGIMQAEPNGRRWRNLDEKNYNYKADLTVPFSAAGLKQVVKIGGDYLFRKRDFNEHLLFLPGSNFAGFGSLPLFQVHGDLNRLVSDEVIGFRPPLGGEGEGAFPVAGFLYNTFKSPNNYRGYYEVQAFYGMADLKFSSRWRLTGGIRLESTDLGSIVDTVGVYLSPSISTPNADGSQIPLLFVEPNSLYRTGFQPFYSLNLVYTLKEGFMNLRGGFNSTLARPELREITNVFEYDAFQMGLVTGNPNLHNQRTENLDFRWEWFTGPGEVVAFSVFGKRIHDQLVRVFSLQTQGLAATYPEFPVIRFENEVNTGYVWGAEAEVVQNLGEIWNPLKYFFLGTNLMLAQSNIIKNDLRYEANRTLDRHTPKNSPLFEQAPYSINGWLNYTHPRWGSDLTLSFNMVGERLVQINLLGEPDLYAQPAPMLDFVWTQRLSRKLEFKGFIKNMLNPGIKTVYANPGTGGIWYGKEYIHRNYKRGTEVMFGFTYNVFD